MLSCDVVAKDVVPAGAPAGAPSGWSELQNVKIPIIRRGDNHSLLCSRVSSCGTTGCGTTALSDRVGNAGSKIERLTFPTRNTLLVTPLIARLASEVPRQQK